MPNTRTSKVIQHLRSAVLRRDEAGAADGQLLECFLTQRDDAALAALVRRHGPMVWGVCRRVLQHHHDAEDAFQATFLVLVRRAASVEPREMVANWLYGVAYRTALKARSLAARRKGRERQVVEMPEPAVEAQEVWRDLEPLLDRELSRLPDKYRVPVVLCDLGGKTRKEAAQQLGWPEGTVAGRLATARKMLAKRLAQRGVLLSVGALSAVLPQSVVAGVPTSVVASTIKAATLFAAGQVGAAGVIPARVAALTEGVLKTTMPARLKIAAAVLVTVAATVVGTGGLLSSTQAPAGDRKAPAASNQNGESAAMKELAKLQGTWIAVSAEKQGNHVPEDELKQAGLRLVIEGEKFTITTARGGTEGMKGTLKIDPGQKPTTIDVTAEVAGGRTATATGICELNGDTLKWCYGKERPTEFKTKPDRGADQRSYVLKRDKK